MTIENLLSALSPSEKLEAMEFLWRDLSRDAESFASPAWHGKVLADRLANPSPEPSLPLSEAIREVKDRLDARRTTG